MTIFIMIQDVNAEICDFSTIMSRLICHITIVIVHYVGCSLIVYFVICKCFFQVAFAVLL